MSGSKKNGVWRRIQNIGKWELVTKPWLLRKSRSVINSVCVPAGEPWLAIPCRRLSPTPQWGNVGRVVLSRKLPIQRGGMWRAPFVGLWQRALLPHCRVLSPVLHSLEGEVTRPSFVSRFALFENDITQSFSCSTFKKGSSPFLPRITS